MRYLLLILSFSWTMLAEANVSISELMPCNISTYRNSNNNFVGWVEIYNDSEDDLDLNGYTIKNQKKDGTVKWVWTISQSSVIPADDYTLLYFDEITDQSFHVGYKLDTDGGTIVLSSGTTVLSSVTYPQMVPHLSYGYYNDVLGFMEPTPKKDNKTSFASLTTSRCVKPSLSVTPGIQTAEEVTVSISSGTSQATIYYTTNGSEPTKDQGKLYEEPITISKTKVIRAKAYKDSMLSSEIVTGSYIFMDDKHKSCNGFSAPIVSIVTDSANFYDNTYGIYVTGTNGTTNPNKSCLSGSANYNQDWTRPVNFEYIVDGKPVISQEIEVSVMGGCSRMYKYKSLKMNASKKAGKNKLEYDFFPEKTGNKYKSLQLRNGGNAYETLRVRDGFMQSIASLLGLDCQAYMPVAYYINGSYAGLMGLRERTNKDYVYSNYGLDEEQIDVLEITEKEVSASCGTKDAYDELVKMLENNNPASEDYYSNAAKYIDMDEYINYHIFEQYIVNTDWPSNNTKIWRERNNGRFRWIVYDTDFGLGLYDAGGPNYTGVDMNMINFAMGEGVTNWGNRDPWMVTIFKHLMQNEEFKGRFLTKYLHHLKYTFTESKMDSLWSIISGRAAGEYCASTSGADLDNDAQGMLSFAKNRPEVIYRNLKEFYKAGEKISLSISVQDVEGKVIPNADIIMNYQPLGSPEYDNYYFSGLTLRVEPKAPIGYTFKEWKLSSEISKTTKVIPLLDQTTTWSYHFSADQPAGAWNAAVYDDSAWEKGVGSFGINSKEYTPKVQLVDSEETDVHFTTSYYRTKFTIDNLETVDSLLANIVYDDGAVVYLNGKEVKRLNMPEGEITYDVYTGADNYVNDKNDQFYINKSFLVLGENVIAVEVHQCEPASADMTFAFNLSEIYGGSLNKGQVLEASLTKDIDMVAVFELSKTWQTPTLVLNEICSSNDENSGNADEYGNYPDWIEIYNFGKENIDMAGMYLTDDVKELKKSIFPYGYGDETVIKAGEHKIIYADNAIWRGPNHADFKISASGSKLALAYNRQDATIILDSITCVPLNTNASYGREDDGNLWVKFGLCIDGENTVTYREKNASGCPEGVDLDDYLADEEGENEGVQIYPNPVLSTLNVKITDDLYENFGDNDIKSISIYNSLGMLERQILCSDKSNASVDVDDFASGIYFVKVETASTVYGSRFMKK